MRRAIALWAPLVLALAAVYWLSSLSQVPGAQYASDKLLHVAGYAGLGLLALRAFHGGIARLRPGPTLAAAAVIVAWGILDELHQSFVPGRDATASDVVADAIGFALAVVIVAAWTGLARDRATAL